MFYIVCLTVCFFIWLQDRTSVIVMGDLPEDTHVSSSPKNPEVVLTIGFLNDKVGNLSCGT